MYEQQESRLVAAGQWLDDNWQYASMVAGLFYLASLPLRNGKGHLPDLLLWLQLPIYFVHQFEEHFDDRFRCYVNSHISQGEPILTPRVMTVINIGSVWCVDFLALYLVKFHGNGSGLFAFYLALVNAVVHVAGAIVSWAYHPGLITAATPLLPLGTWGAMVYSTAYALPVRDHVTALAAVIALHLAIILHFVRRRDQFAHPS